MLRVEAIHGGPRTGKFRTEASSCLVQGEGRVGAHEPRRAMPAGEVGARTATRSTCGRRSRLGVTMRTTTRAAAGLLGRAPGPPVGMTAGTSSSQARPPPPVPVAPPALQRRSRAAGANHRLGRSPARGRGRGAAAAAAARPTAAITTARPVGRAWPEHADGLEGQVLHVPDLIDKGTFSCGTGKAYDVAKKDEACTAGTCAAPADVSKCCSDQAKCSTSRTTQGPSAAPARATTPSTPTSSVLRRRARKTRRPTWRRAAYPRARPSAAASRAYH